MGKKLFGIIGLTGAGLCVIGVAMAAVFMDISPLDGFFSQLGMVPVRLITPLGPSLFNVSISVFGLSFGAYWVFRGLNEDTWQQTILSLLGALTGLLAFAMALFTLNHVPYHYYVLGAFYASLFVLAAAYIVIELRFSMQWHIARLIAGGLTGLCGAAGAVFTFTGGMSNELIQVVSQTGDGIGPFALVGWAAFLLLLVFTVLLNLELFSSDNFEYSDNETNYYRARPNRREIEF